MKNKNIKIGFSSGALKKSNLNLLARLEFLQHLKCQALELHFIGDELYSPVVKRLKAACFKKFKYISLHAPMGHYGDNETTEKIFGIIRKINEMLNLDTVVFHPDCVTDLSILDKIGFPVAFENMDSRNSSFQTPDKLVSIINSNKNFKLVLDLNHAYTNDHTMALAKKFYTEFSHKIIHIHLSGYRSSRLGSRHVPLFQTGQIKIIRAVKNFNLPIIVESNVSLIEAKNEYEYILDNLKF